MDMFHMPHGQLTGYLSHAAWNQLVGVKRRSRTPGCKLLCSTCCSAGKEQFANREAVGDGSRRCVVALKGAHTRSKNPPPISQPQAYMTYARLRCGYGGGGVALWWVRRGGDVIHPNQLRFSYGYTKERTLG